MFIGHYAVALAAKRVAPRTNLGVLFAAVQWPDLLWPILLLTGQEEVVIEPGRMDFSPLHFTRYPISHGLAANLGWAALWGVLYWIIARYQRGAWVVGLGVLSHWLLDAIVHEPDLPLVPGSSARVGLGLWESIPLTIGLECLMLLGAVWLFLKQTRPQGTVRLYGFWLMLVLLMGMYLSGPFSPPPSDTRSLALFALGGWVVPLLAGWIDRRQPGWREGIKSDFSV